MIAVLLHHSWSALPSFGHEGVRLFFVISGFLITAILLDGKALAESAAPEGRRAVLRQFYIRRFLRIFPAYYAVLLVLAALEWQVLGNSFPFHLTYTSNFWFALTEDWSPGFTAPFWSLSIEEQFYLCWPFLLLWIPRKHLWIAVAALVLLGPLSRMIMLAAGLQEIARTTLTPASFDALGAGALLALVRGTPRAEAAIRGSGWMWLLLLAGMYLGWRAGALPYAYWMQYVLTETLWVLLFMAVVAKAAIGFGGPLGILLTWAPLRYVGRISYGVYLFHSPLLHLMSKWLDKAGLSMPADGHGRFVLLTAATISAAALSWHFFEAPINRLKKLFPYPQQATSPGRVRLAGKQGGRREAVEG